MQLKDLNHSERVSLILGRVANLQKYLNLGAEDAVTATTFTEMRNELNRIIDLIEESEEASGRAN